MVGVILAGHGVWPTAMKESLEMIMGEQKAIEICTVTNVESTQQIHAKMDEAMERLGECSGYVFLLDLFGGSPSHGVVSYGFRDDIIALTGANLAMLLQVASLREELPWKELGAELIKTGQDAIRDIFGELKQMKGRSSEESVFLAN